MALISARVRICWRGVGASSSCEGEVGVDWREREGEKVARMVASESEGGEGVTFAESSECDEVLTMKQGYGNAALLVY